mgnify:CR=1 FL=1
MAISPQHAQSQLDLYLQAERDILTHGQTTRLGDRQRTRADLAEIRAGITYWERKASSARRPRMINITPRG